MPNEPPIDPTTESTESQIVRGADDDGEDTDFSLRGPSGLAGIDEQAELMQARDVGDREDEP